MTPEFGYAGKILNVDLSRRSVTEVPTADYADGFLGGRGIAARIYWDGAVSEVKAFDPENQLLFVTGPLAGFPGLAGSRWEICGKSPATNPESFSHANLGGSWGAHLKFAGYDAIVIRGKSDKPVYLLIQDGVTETRDASFLWGKGTIEVRQTLKELLGKEVRVLATGPAGDNMATMANVFCDNDASGSGGFGAVMGSKKLKAIAVRGSGKLVASNPEKLRELRKHILSLRKDAPSEYAAGYRSPFVLENPKMKKIACYGCISGCIRTIYEADNGEKGKYMCQSLMLYPVLSEKYYGKMTDAAFHASRLCDDYGLDIAAINEITLWLRKCYRGQILTDENTGIPLSKIGSLEFMEALVKRISLRQGFGDVLAQGIFKAADSVGDAARQQLGASTHKTGRTILYDPRLYVTTGLLYATEPRVPVEQLHKVSSVILQWIDWHNKVDGAYLSGSLVSKIAAQFFGSEIAMDFSTYEGKALAAKKIQDREYAKACLILCDFSWPIMHARHSESHSGDATIEGEVLSAVTGREMDEENLYRIGEKVFNLQRSILAREGHDGRKSDSLPESHYTAPIGFNAANPECLMPGKDGEVISRQGAVVDRGQFEKMKDEYYQLRGWDVTTGLQTRAKLKEIGLEDVAEELEQRGLLV